MPAGKSPGSAPGRNGSRDFAFSSSRPKITCEIAPSGAGRIRHLPGFAVKPLASANCRPSAGNAPLIASQFALVAKVMGMALAAGAVSNTEGMVVSGCLKVADGVPATYTRLDRRDRFPANQH